MDSERIVVTEELVRTVNNNRIEGKQYSSEVKEAAARLPRLTPQKINGTWAKVMRDARTDS